MTWSDARLHGDVCGQELCSLSRCYQTYHWIKACCSLCNVVSGLQHSVMGISFIPEI